MPIRLTPAAACRAALAAGTPRSSLHPVYRVLGSPAAGPVPSDGAGTHRAGTEGIGGTGHLDAEDLATVIAHVTSPAMLVLAVADGGSTRSLRVGLQGAAATLERSAPTGSGPHPDPAGPGGPGAAGGATPGLLEAIPLVQVPRALAAWLPEGPLAAPPLLTRPGEDRILRLDPDRARHLASSRPAGGGDTEPAAAGEGTDPRLADALGAAGPRASLSLTLRPAPDDPDSAPVTFSRLWTLGRLGLYRVDAAGTPAGQIVHVEAGDVLGTALPLLEQGVQYSAGRTPEEAMSR